MLLFPKINAGVEMSEIRLPARVGEWTREHVGPGAGKATVTEYLGGSFRVALELPGRPLIEERHPGPAAEARRRADELSTAGHSCSGCPPWPE